MTRSASSGTGFANLSLAEQNEKVQSRIIKHLEKQSTSVWARHSNYMKLQGTQYAMFNGRPASATGPPVALYHPVFDAFTNELDSTAELPTQTYALVNDLLEASQAMYPTELGPNSRTQSLRPILEKLLPPYLGIREAPGTKSDGLITARNGAPCMVMEINNEIGTGGSDPTVQGAISYAKYWGENQLDWIRYLCCCPSFILAISGPWICILGAVMLDHPVIQPLTSFLWAANHPKSASLVDQIARVFSSLSAAISKLQDFYAGLSRNDPAANRHDPYQRHYLEHGMVVQFSYFRGLDPGKTVFPAQTKPPENQPGAERREIIVKFAESYHVDAHRLLAAKGLAPELKFVSSEGDEGFEIGNLTMLVMERVSGKELTDLKIDRPPQCVVDDIARALKILHDNDIVFGDLRPPNVMAVQDEKGNVTGGMLIDFDWCGRHGEAKYPPDINMRINWPEGVGPGTIMQKEHDDEMFGKLFSI